MLAYLRVFRGERLSGVMESFRALELVALIASFGSKLVLKGEFLETAREFLTGVPALVFI